MQQARHIVQVRHGTAREPYAKALAMEAQVSLARGDLPAALEIQEKVLAVREAASPSTSAVLVAMALGDVAATHALMGQPGRALAYRR